MTYLCAKTRIFTVRYHGAINMPIVNGGFDASVSKDVKLSKGQDVMLPEQNSWVLLEVCNFAHAFCHPEWH